MREGWVLNWMGKEVLYEAEEEVDKVEALF